MNNQAGIVDRNSNASNPIRNMLEVFRLISLFNLDSPYVQGHPAKKFVQDAGFIGRGSSLGPPGYLGKTPPKHAAEPRDCLCQPRASQRVGGRIRVRVQVTSGVGLVWADVQG